MHETYITLLSNVTSIKIILKFLIKKEKMNFRGFVEKDDDKEERK